MRQRRGPSSRDQHRTDTPAVTKVALFESSNPTRPDTPAAATPRRVLPRACFSDACVQRPRDCGGPRHCGPAATLRPVARPPPPSVSNPLSLPELHSAEAPARTLARSRTYLPSSISRGGGHGSAQPPARSLVTPSPIAGRHPPDFASFRRRSHFCSHPVVASLQARML